MEKLNKDLIRLLAMELDSWELLQFCQTSKKYSEICKSVWRNKIRKDFPKIDISQVEEKNLNKLYVYLTKKPNTIFVDFAEIPNDDINQIDLDILEDYGINFGDVVVFDNYPLRKYIWTGETFEVDYNDDYFILHEPLSFPNYPPNYWRGIIDFNYTYLSIVPENGYIKGKFGERYPIETETQFNKFRPYAYFDNDYTIKDFL